MAGPGALVTDCYLIGLAERDRLRAFPERQATELLEVLCSLDERGEVVRPQLAGLALEVAVAVGEEQLRLALPARIQGQLSRVRIRRRILGPDP